jgi:hypothetical protein
VDFSDRELSMNADEHESRVAGLDACSCDGGAAAAPPRLQRAIRWKKQKSRRRN